MTARPALALAIAALALLGACSGGSGEGAPEGQATTSTAVVPGSGSTTAASVPAGTSGLVPDLAGRTLDEGLAEIRSVGLGEVEALDLTGQGRLVDAGTEWVVAAQSPPGGTPAAPGSKVVLFVHRSGEAAGTPTDLGFVAVPDLLYATTGDAATALSGVGFGSITLGDFAGQDRAVAADGSWVVLAQDPAPGAWARAGDAVVLQALPSDEAPAG